MCISIHVRLYISTMCMHDVCARSHKGKIVPFLNGCTDATIFLFFFGYVQRAWTECECVHTHTDIQTDRQKDRQTHIHAFLKRQQVCMYRMYACPWLTCWTHTQNTWSWKANASKVQGHLLTRKSDAIISALAVQKSQTHTLQCSNHGRWQKVKSY